jgi:hypothetical protein
MIEFILDLAADKSAGALGELARLSTQRYPETKYALRSAER